MDLNTSQLYIDQYIAVGPERSATPSLGRVRSLWTGVRHADIQVHPKVIDRQRGRPHDRINLAGARYRYSDPWVIWVL